MTWVFYKEGKLESSGVEDSIPFSFALYALNEGWGTFVEAYVREEEKKEELLAVVDSFAKSAVHFSDETTVRRETYKTAEKVLHIIGTERVTIYIGVHFRHNGKWWIEIEARRWRK